MILQFMKACDKPSKTYETLASRSQPFLNENCDLDGIGEQTYQDMSCVFPQSRPCE